MTAIASAWSGDGLSVRLISRGGYDWTKRLPWIAEAALKNRRKQFVIDGEAVILGVDGVSDFRARKVNLDRLLRGRPHGIFVNAFEAGAIGPATRSLLRYCPERCRCSFRRKGNRRWPRRPAPSHRRP
jgi:hypothetical protein